MTPRANRFDHWVTWPRAVAIVTTPLALSTGVFFWLVPFDRPWREGGLLLSLASALLAPALVVRPRRDAAWVLLAAQAGLAALFLSGEYRQHVGGREQLAESLVLAGLVGLAGLVLLMACRLAPARALLLAVSVWVPLSGWWIWDQWRSRQVAPAWPYWLYEQGTSLPDPQRGYRVAPHSRVKTYYPDNPRGYFETAADAPADPASEPATGSVELFPLELRLMPGGQGREVSADDEPRQQRVEIDAAQPDQPWLVQWAYPSLPVKPGRLHVVTFRARADQPRTLLWSVFPQGSQARTLAPWQASNLTDAWSEFTAVFALPDQPKPGELIFNLAGGAGAIEIADLRLAVQNQGLLYPLQLRVLEGSAGREVPSPRGPLIQRAEIDEVNVEAPWTLQYAFRNPPLMKGRRHVLTLRARADAEREILWTIHRVGSKPEPIVPWRSVPLGPRWGTYTSEFVATTDATETELVINLAGHPAAVELEEVRISVEEAAEPAGERTPGATPYWISVNFNDQGFRDRDYPLERPEHVFRIVCLGDSMTFGQGVRQDEVFSELLEKSLNRASAEPPTAERPRFEVINCGMCGYSTREERACYELAARRYQPQVVLLVMFNNDYADAGEQSHVRLERFAHLQAAEHALARAAGQLYTDCLGEVTRLEASCAADQARLGIVLFRYGEWDPLWRGLHHAVSTTYADDRVPWFDLGPGVLERFRPQDCTVHPRDGHANERVHALAARLIEEFLFDRGLIPAELRPPPATEPSEAPAEPSDAPNETGEAPAESNDAPAESSEPPAEPEPSASEDAPTTAAGPTEEPAAEPATQSEPAPVAEDAHAPLP